MAIGQLGPPQLAKYLYEAHLLRELYGTIEGVLRDAAEDRPRRPAEISEAMREKVLTSELRHTIVSVGIPILLPDGATILRGPVIKIPAYNRKAREVALDPEKIDRFARKGWVDLRPSHVGWWLEQLKEMRGTVYRRGSKWSSERLDYRSYLSEEIRIGEIVAWIFNNVIEPAGHRIK